MLRPFHIAALALLVGLIAAGCLFAQAQGRLQATVVDENGEPLAGVEVSVTNEEIAYEQQVTTDKKGRFSIIFVDATRTYNFKFVKEGYQPTDTPFKTGVGGNTRHTFTVPSGKAAPAAAPPPGEAVRSRNPAINVFNEGVAAFQGGDAAGAKEKFHKAIEMDPDLVAPYSALAGIFLDERDFAQAEAMANKVLALEPENTRALRVLYDAYRETGRDADADATLGKLKTLDRGTDTAVRVFNEGAEAARLGDLKTAKARFTEALEVDPELAPAYAALATVHLTQKAYAEALAAADQALDIDPGRADALKVKYEVYRGLGDDAKAREVFQELVAQDPAGTARALYDRGIDMFNAGNTAGAKTAFEQALEADAGNARAHYMLGLCYVNSGESAKAKEQLQEFLELAPDDPDAATAKEMLKFLG